MMAKNLSIIAISILIAALLAIPALPPVKATPFGVFDVFAPTALDAEGWSVDWQENAKKLDSSPAGLAETASYVTTQNFVDPTYQNYWAPYSNRSAFPPGNATFLTISMITVLRCQVTRSFTLGAIIGNGTPPWDLHNYIDVYYTTQSWSLYSYNLTIPFSDYGIFEHWNTSEIMITVRAGLVAGGHCIYVDYVGLSYTWEYANESGIGPGGPGGPGTEFNVANLDVPGLMGIFGFVGMIGIPAASIWFFRQDGGSKIYAGVMALVAFTVCFGLFYGSINGG